MEEHGEWYRQLFHGFRALKIRVSLGAITYEDIERWVIDGTATADRHPESRPGPAGSTRRVPPLPADRNQ